MGGWITAGRQSERLLDVSRHVMADGDDAGRLRHERCRRGVGIPALGAEREELRRVRQVNNAAGRAVVGFAQQRVAEVFGGDKHPIGAPV